MENPGKEFAKRKFLEYYEKRLFEHFMVTWITVIDENDADYRRLGRILFIDLCEKPVRSPRDFENNMSGIRVFTNGVYFTEEYETERYDGHIWIKSFRAREPKDYIKEAMEKIRAVSICFTIVKISKKYTLVRILDEEFFLPTNAHLADVFSRGYKHIWIPGERVKEFIPVNLENLKRLSVELL